MNSTASHGDSKQSAALDKLVRRRQNEDWSRGARVLRRPFATPERIDEIVIRLRPHEFFCVGDLLSSRLRS